MILCPISWITIKNVIIINSLNDPVKIERTANAYTKLFILNILFIV